jgi:uncharacterized membrane protein
VDRPAAQWTDEQIDRLLGNLLRAGVVAAAAVVLVGGCVYLARHGGEPSDRRTFRGEPAELRSPAGIVAAALAGESRAMIGVGLLLLIATPVARVAAAAYAFARERDRLYTAVALVVLGILVASLAAP